MMRGESFYGGQKQMGVSENSVPLNPMVLLIIIPIKWLFHWEYTLFSDKPKSLFSNGFIIFPFFPVQKEHWPIYSTFKSWHISFPAKSPLCGISFDWTAELCCRERKCSSQLGCSPGWVIEISERKDFELEPVGNLLSELS